MNLTWKMLNKMMSEQEFEDVSYLLKIENRMNDVSYYSGFIIALLNLVILFLSIIIHLSFLYHPNNHKSSSFLCFQAKCTPEIESPPVQTCGQVQWSLHVIFVNYDQ